VSAAIFRKAITKRPTSFLGPFPRLGGEVGKGPGNEVGLLEKGPGNEAGKRQK